MKEAVNDVFKLVKNEGNLIFNFENAVDKVASHHNVNKDDFLDEASRKFVGQCMSRQSAFPDTG